MWSWRGVVNLPEANQLLKIIPEAVPTLNPCANMCQYDVCKNTISCWRIIRKNKDDLAKTINKYETHRGKEAIYIKWCRRPIPLALTGMLT